MLHVLWVVLKIILWILLGLLGLVVLLLALVLFVPVCYRVDAVLSEDIVVSAKVRFLFVTFQISYRKNQKLLDQVLRIAGIPLSGGKKGASKDKDKPEKKKDKKKKQKQSEEEKNQEQQDQIEGKNREQQKDQIEREDQIEQKNQEQNQPVVKAEESQKEDTLGETQTPEKRDFLNEEFDLWDNDLEETEPEEKKKQKQKHPAETFEEKLNKLEGKINKLKKTVKRFLKFWNLGCTKRTRDYLKSYLLGLLLHIAPRKAKGYLRYGFDEPYKTGQITGYLSLCPFVYQKHFSLYPDFYEKVLEGNVTLKGHLTLGYIARIVLKRDLWKTIKAFKKWNPASKEASI